MGSYKQTLEELTERLRARRPSEQNQPFVVEFEEWVGFLAAVYAWCNEKRRPVRSVAGANSPNFMWEGVGIFFYSTRRLVASETERAES